MPKLGLVKPDHLARLRMFCYCPSYVPYSQAVVVLPLHVYGCASAVPFHRRSIIGFEKVLPSDIEVARKVPNIHDSFLLETLQDFRINLLVELATVHDRSFPAALGGLNAKEPLLHRPLVHVGTLVVKQN